MSVRPLFACLVFSLFASALSLKFLCYIALFGKSHVNYQGKVADALIEAGHQVVFVAPQIDGTMKPYKTKNASRVILIEGCPEAKQLTADLQQQDGMGHDLWEAQSITKTLKGFERLYSVFASQCNYTLHQPGLIQQLKDEKFDAAFAESLDACAVVLFNLAGITKHVATQSLPSIETSFELTGSAAAPSYVPGIMAKYGEDMTFLERLENVVAHVLMRLWAYTNIYLPFKQILNKEYPELPDLAELYSSASLTFLNTEPLIDFPRPTVHTIVEIGGIVTGDVKPLNEEWNSIMNLRPKTVLLSFGTVTNSSSMPDEFKESIREAFRRLPDVTFIWKYEAPEHNIGEGIDNIIVTTWVPQNDLLHDRRLSGFITHGGVGSLMEATIAGVPMIVIPIMGDQLRNAQLIKRLRSGVLLLKNQLGNADELEQSIKELLEDDRYTEKARTVAQMIASRPFSMKEVLVRNMEFVARFGPLTHLQQYGRHLNFFQYYLLDIAAFLTVLALVPLILLYFALKAAIKWCIRKANAKSKKD